MVIFLFITTAIIVAGHVGLYASWVKFFSIGNVKIKILLRVVLAVLSVSFLITTLLTFWRDGAFINALYAGAGAWLGMVWYLALAAAVTWIVVLVGHAFGAKMPLAIIAGAFIVVGLAFSIYGLWSAQHPTVRRISVTIPNLPQAWKGRTAVQLSDIHLGPVHREQFMQRVVDKVKSLNPDVVFVTGDLFDGEGRDLEHLAEPLNGLTPPFGSYFITGNHETYIGLDKALSALQTIKVKVLRDAAVDVAGMSIVGVDYPMPGERKDFAKVMSTAIPGEPSIVLWHQPSDLDTLKNLGASLVLSGHTHDGQLWPFNYITDAVFPGHGYGLSTDGTFSAYTSSGIGTWGAPMRTTHRPEIVVITFE